MQVNPAFIMIIAVPGSQAQSGHGQTAHLGQDLLQAFLGNLGTLCFNDGRPELAQQHVDPARCEGLTDRKLLLAIMQRLHARLAAGCLDGCPLLHYLQLHSTAEPDRL